MTVTGLIPAHAGKTGVSDRGGRTPEAHPRSRGENGRFEGAGACETGSSPLTRGKLSSPPRFQRLLGSSPLTRGKRYVD